MKLRLHSQHSQAPIHHQNDDRKLHQQMNQAQSDSENAEDQVLELLHLILQAQEE